MNAVKIQYEIRDVIPEVSQKKSRHRIKSASSRQQVPGTNETSRKESLPSAQSQKSAIIDQTLPAVGKVAAVPSSGTTAPLPIKPTTPNFSRRNPHPKVSSDKPDWNISLTVPDRDLLIMEQDLEIDRYKSRHKMYDYSEHPIPQPTLTEFEVRKSLKERTSEEHRDRLVHHSFGAAENDPLPFYPHLKHQHGIHSARWINDSKLPVEHEDWAKPLPKADKTREAFRKVYCPSKPPAPSQEIAVEHSIASVVSSYTLAKERSFKDKPEK